MFGFTKEGMRRLFANAVRAKQMVDGVGLADKLRGQELELSENDEKLIVARIALEVVANGGGPDGVAARETLKKMGVELLDG